MNNNMNFSFKNDVVFYGDNQKFAFENIAFAGELTTSQGPDLPDHFIVIGEKSGVVLEVPWGVFGKPFIDMVERLESLLSVSSFKELINHTDYLTVIHFPSEFAGEPIYNYNENRGAGLKFAIRKALGINRAYCEINPRLMDFLNDERGCCRLRFYRLTG